MIYTLRLNNHRRDHGRLLCESLMPAIRAERGTFAGLQVALQPHWLHGPHLALAVEGPGKEEATASITREVIAWMSEQTPVLIDAASYEREQRALAIVENIPDTWQGLRPDLTVETGDHTPPAPRGDPRLAPLRDGFRVATLETVASLVSLRLGSTGDAIVAFARLFTALEHVRFAAPGNPWPLSPRGQAEAAASLLSSPKAQAAVEAVETGLEQQVEQEGLLRAEGAWDASFVGVLQRSHDDALAFALANVADVSRWADEETGDITGEPAGMDRERWRTVLANPAHFAYRFTINHLYDMQPLAGLSTVHRAIACTALAGVSHRHSGIASRAKQAGLAF
jgi:hypothetical protein